MWLSLVEHSVRDAGVGGSNPLIPTTYQKFPLQIFSFFSKPKLTDFLQNIQQFQIDGTSIIYNFHIY